MMKISSNWKYFRFNDQPSFGKKYSLGFSKHMHQQWNFYCCRYNHAFLGPVHNSYVTSTSKPHAFNSSPGPCIHVRLRGLSSTPMGLCKKAGSRKSAFGWSSSLTLFSFLRSRRAFHDSAFPAKTPAPCPQHRTCLHGLRLVLRCDFSAFWITTSHHMI